MLLFDQIHSTLKLHDEYTSRRPRACTGLKQQASWASLGLVAQILFWFGMSGLPARPRMGTWLGLGFRRILPIHFLNEQQDHYYLLNIFFACLISKFSSIQSHQIFFGRYCQRIVSNCHYAPTIPLQHGGVRSVSFLKTSDDAEAQCHPTKGSRATWTILCSMTSIHVYRHVFRNAWRGPGWHTGVVIPK